MIGVILFGQALITFSMAMSTIFTDSKLSTQVGNFLLFLPTGFLIFALITIMSKRFISSIENLPKQLMGEEYEEYDGQKWFQIGYVFPHFSFGIIILDYFVENGAELTMGLDVTYAWIALVSSIPFYFLLYIYLDAIIPNAFGIALRPCFCLRKQKESESKKRANHMVQRKKNDLDLSYDDEDNKPQVKI